MSEQILISTTPDSENSHTPNTELPKKRIRFGVIVTILGYIVFLLGARPGLFGLDRSKVIGFVQITVFLIGLAIIAIGSYYTLMAFWTNTPKTLLVDFGSRVISTGYVICFFSALADVLGFGSHHLPNVFFGPLQADGVMAGILVMAIGYVMMIRFHRTASHSS